jgi:hypothetical protein
MKYKKLSMYFTFLSERTSAFESSTSSSVSSSIHSIKRRYFYGKYKLYISAFSNIFQTKHLPLVWKSHQKKLLSRKITSHQINVPIYLYLERKKISHGKIFNGLKSTSLPPPAAHKLKEIFLKVYNNK